MSLEMKMERNHCDWEQLKKEEAIFSLANGKIGIRGCLEEDFLIKNSYDNNTYMYGFFEKEKINYGENAYGYAKNHQIISPVPSGHGFAVLVDGETVSLVEGKVIKHQRIFDMEKATLNRLLEWESKTGKKIKIKSSRTILQNPKIKEDSLMSFEIEPINFDGEILIQSFYGILENDIDVNGDDPRVKNTLLKTLQYQYTVDNNSVNFISKALNTGVSVFAKFNESIDFVSNKYITKMNNSVIFNYKCDVDQGKHYKIICSGRYEFDEFIEEINLDEIQLLRSNDEHMKLFWEDNMVKIEGDTNLNSAIAFNIYHLYQSVGRTNNVNIAAKGLSGAGYEGHYFWDTEMYMIHQFIYTQPEIAKSLLMYRYNILPKAKERARELGIKDGVLFPWRTIDGEENSAYYPAGTAQVHINSDIAYAVVEYYKATHDDEFMKTAGIEILVETAKFWIAFGDFINGEFCINGVTGPDEYTALVNNNYYTNKIAQYNLLNAINYVKKYSYSGVTENELEEWHRAASLMRLPYCNEKQLTMQDDSIFDKAIWDFENTSKNQYPLLLNFHPMIIYRYQVNKQADTILAHYLFFAEENAEQINRDFDYYERITTHDSSLSKSIFGIVATLLGNVEKGYEYFMDTVYMDLDDKHQNVIDGIHAANMGGMWLSLIKGFSGFTYDKNGIPMFTNRIPKEWKSIQFNMKIRGSKIKINMIKDKTEASLLQGEEIDIILDNELITLKK
ncbi:glycoside hydrolase family 65 protein [Aerococcaceae bacterium zg-BR9]|uniref:glycoside hydrolase family 65 protein n=1 Tax=Aerococcaceae bacterium zg-1292 TaxID=2774330 RepID=UPI00406409EC|nr:glycoside hydrolase family 65 protein [Aerococcaceae bacterium zg-BR9]